MQAKKQKGFTLIEIIVSIAILAIIGFSVMDAFATSSKLNRNAKVIDYATIKATNSIEKLKKDPKGFVNKMNKGNQEYFDKTGNKLPQDQINNATKSKTNYKSEIYFDYDWKEVSKDKSVYTLKVNVNEELDYGDKITYTPQSNQVIKRAGLENGIKVKKNVHDYFLYIIDRPDYYIKNKEYQVYLMMNTTKDGYFNWLYADGPNVINFEDGYKPLLIYNAVKEGSSSTKALNDFNVLKGSYEIFTYHALCAIVDRDIFSMAMETRKTEGEDGNIIIDLGDKIPDNGCNIQVLNDTMRNVEIYLNGQDIEKSKKNVNIDIIKGVVTKTIIDNSKKSQGVYDTDIEVISNNDGKQIYELKANEYVVN